MDTVLRIALQKKGRLSEKTIEVLKACGLDFNSTTDQLIAPASNFPVEFLYLRDDDIPQYVHDDVADLGIVGYNVVVEKKCDLEIIEKLGFSKCRLSIAIPQKMDFESISQLNGLRIATSYPNILQTFLKTKGIKTDIHVISGSVEIAPAIGLADAICDIVSTGSTLLSNGLREIETVFQSEAVLVANKEMSSVKKALLEKLLLRMRSVLRAKNHKYIILNTLNTSIPQIVKLLPGMKSPTVTPLAQEGWSSLHSVIREDEFWDVIEKLREEGAEGILVMPIEKMIF